MEPKILYRKVLVTGRELKAVSGDPLRQDQDHWFVEVTLEGRVYIVWWRGVVQGTFERARAGREPAIEMAVDIARLIKQRYQLDGILGVEALGLRLGVA